MSKKGSKASTLPNYRLRNRLYLLILLFDLLFFSFKPPTTDYLATSLSPTPSATPTNTPTLVPTRPPISPLPTQPPPADTSVLIDKYGEKYGVSKDLLRKIAKCESGFRPEAVNGPYAGMYQFLASTWASNRKAMGENPDPSLRFNAEEAVKTASFKISRDGPGAWPVCSRKALTQANPQT